MITFWCTSCGADLRVLDDKAGRKGKCPKCGAQTVILLPGALQGGPPKPATVVTPGRCNVSPNASPPQQMGAPMPDTTTAPRKTHGPVMLAVCGGIVALVVVAVVLVLFLRGTRTGETKESPQGERVALVEKPTQSSQRRSERKERTELPPIGGAQAASKPARPSRAEAKPKVGAKDHPLTSDQMEELMVGLGFSVRLGPSEIRDEAHSSLYFNKMIDGGVFFIRYTAPSDKYELFVAPMPESGRTAILMICREVSSELFTAAYECLDEYKRTRMGRARDAGSYRVTVHGDGSIYISSIPMKQ